ncbi:ABC transporter permease [Candidatus Methylomirabilis limnetica]|uniref:ABC transporter permease n=1 Tax=Candidatus Methylomirabilis limnetica TaxID=2033718 RepID=A0A2T4U166_9BACT|nr:ABC transporter permease subunit [Candidatus Methylomirabilis limnetica]PTL37105.1 ABC transporter permease [Candidatus Methylomirabilis limnetica]
MNVLAIFKKEFRAYFASPIAYVVLTIFALISGFFFYSLLTFFSLNSLQAATNPGFGRDLNVSEWIVRPLFRDIAITMLLLMPAATMRLFSEEKKTGTIELLFTYPIKDWELLLGKFLAALALYSAMLGISLLDIALLGSFAALEWGLILTGYIGLLLLGMAFLGLGILASALTENQVVAAVGSFGILLLLWVIGWSAEAAGPTLGPILSHLSIINHYDSFAKGTIESRDVIYYLNFTLLCLFLTLRSLESKRWRG